MIASAAPVATMLLASLSILGASGCALGQVPPTGDTFAGWSSRPLAPDPDLAAMALGPNSACHPGDDPAPVRILVQDRRTESTAVFLVATDRLIGSCEVTDGGGTAGGSLSTGPGPMTGPLSIDAEGGGNVGSGYVTELGGRVAVPADEVIVELADGRAVVASLANGYWLAWWPDTTSPARVIATDAAGAEVASLPVVEP